MTSCSDEVSRLVRLCMCLSAEEERTAAYIELALWWGMCLHCVREPKADQRRWSSLVFRVTNTTHLPGSGVLSRTTKHTHTHPHPHAHICTHSSESSEWWLRAACGVLLEVFSTPVWTEGGGWRRWADEDAGLEILSSHENQTCFPENIYLWMRRKTKVTRPKVIAIILPFDLMLKAYI